MSGGIDSLFSDLIKKNNIKKLEEIVLKIKETFQERFYFEIQRHGDIGEKILKIIL